MRTNHKNQKLARYKIHFFLSCVLIGQQTIRKIQKEIVGSQTQELPRWNLKLLPHMEGKERLKKEADLSKLVRGSLNK